MRDNRISRRYKLNIPIAFTAPGVQELYDAMMQDTCLEGMCFEANRSFPRDTPLYIRATPEIRKCNAHDVYIGKVRWCAKKNGSSGNPFGVGIRYTFKGRLLHPEEVCSFAFYCDICGDRLAQYIHIAGDSSHLCQRCFQTVGQIAGDSLHDAIINYSIGNVI